MELGATPKPHCKKQVQQAGGACTQSQGVVTWLCSEFEFGPKIQSFGQDLCSNNYSGKHFGLQIRIFSGEWLGAEEAPNQLGSKWLGGCGVCLGVLVAPVADVDAGIGKSAVVGIGCLLHVFFRIMTLGKVADWGGWDIIRQAVLPTSS